MVMDEIDKDDVEHQANGLLGVHFKRNIINVKKYVEYILAVSVFYLLLRAAFRI